MLVKRTKSKKQRERQNEENDIPQRKKRMKDQGLNGANGGKRHKDAGKRSPISLAVKTMGQRNGAKEKNMPGVKRVTDKRAEKTVQKEITFRDAQNERGKGEVKG